MSLKEQIIAVLPSLMADGKEIKVGEVLARLKQTLPASGSVELKVGDVNSALYSLAAKGVLQRIVTPGVLAPSFKLVSGVSVDKKDQKGGDELETKILAVLGTAGAGFVLTKDISSAVGAPTATTNKVLYNLMNAGKVVKQSEANGTKPRWALKQQNIPGQSYSIAAISQLQVPQTASAGTLMPLLTVDPKVQEFNTLKAGLPIGDVKVATTAFVIYRDDNQKEQVVPVSVNITKVSQEKSILVTTGDEVKYGMANIVKGAMYELPLDPDGSKLASPVNGRNYDFHWMSQISPNAFLVVKVSPVVYGN